MVNTLTIKNSPCKNKSEKIIFHKKNFLEKKLYAIRNKQNCEREEGRNV
jgi:hypothetical protein